MIRNQIKIIFICLRHGINPFGRVCDNKDKIVKRLSGKEKETIIAISNKYYSEYWRKEFVENRR